MSEYVAEKSLGNRISKVTQRVWELNLIMAECRAELLPPDDLPVFSFSNPGGMVSAEGGGSSEKLNYVSVVFLQGPTHLAHCLTWCQFSEEKLHPSVRHALIKRSQEHRAVLQMMQLCLF